jgi:transcriptional regulator
VYIPEHFRVRHHADAIAFMRANPFVILVSTTDDGPFASHIPVFIEERRVQENDELIIRGHVAKANPHWRYLEQNPQCLTIFHGAHAYISPSLYESRESVPTWNYGAVHAYGGARTFSEPDQLLPMLHQLMGTFEAAYAQQWSELSEAYHERMLSHIVGFEITVTKLEAKFKLGQNRTKVEQTNMMVALAKSEDSVISGVADLMQAQGMGEKKNE